jgi:hypothetical protein
MLDSEALFITFAETLHRYPGGLSGLAKSQHLSYSTLRRIRDTAFGQVPRHHLRTLATAGAWDGVPGMNGLGDDAREARLMKLYRRAKRYPECGHSVCSQHFIETGITACIELSSRRRGLLLPL